MPSNHPFKPSDILSEDQNYTIVKGLKLRKGTIAAALKNADIIEDPISNEEQIKAAYESIKEAAPGLVVLGLHTHVAWKNPKIQAIIEETASQLIKAGIL